VARERRGGGKKRRKEGRKDEGRLLERAHISGYWKRILRAERRRDVEEDAASGEARRRTRLPGRKGARRTSRT